MRFVSKTQYDVCVVRQDMQVEFVVKRGATSSTPRKTAGDSARIMRTLTVFNDLVNIGKSEADHLGDEADEQYHLLRELQKVSSFYFNFI